MDEEEDEETETEDETVPEEEKAPEADKKDEVPDTGEQTSLMYVIVLMLVRQRQMELICLWAY